MENVNANTASILNDINADLPPDIDWKAGAIEYLESVKKNGIGVDALSKPFWRLTPDSGQHAYEEVADLLGNFIDVFKLVNLPAGGRILDVACGTGWLAHFWAKLGYKAYGFDICPDFIELARQRFHDQNLTAADLNSMFQVHDIETGSLKLPEPIDVAVFESCFHHFYNPVDALRNVGAMLSESGVAVLIEGGNQITPEFRDVMLQYRTIERPYSREQIKKILRAAGMPYFAFFAPVNSWIAQGCSSERQLQVNVESAFGLQNRCICAKTEAAIKRILPDWTPESPVEMGFGFHGGAKPSSWWCGPYGHMRVLEDCGIELQISPSSADQVISIYSSRRGRIASERSSGVQHVKLDGLCAGESLHLCSDHAFSPMWSVGDDSRLFSFSVEIHVGGQPATSRRGPQQSFLRRSINRSRLLARQFILRYL